MIHRSWFAHVTLASLALVAGASSSTACGGSTDDAVEPSDDAGATAADAAAPTADAGSEDAHDAATPTYTIGGHVTGLAGGGLTLRIDDAEDVAVAATDAIYAFPTPLASGASYSVAVKSNPTSPWQTCTLANATGAVATADVTDVDVTCDLQTFAITGAITGVTTDDVVLTNTPSAGDPEDLPIASGAATFAFTQKVPSGATYAVTAASPTLRCAVTTGAGTVAGADVTDVAVACESRVFDFAFTGAEQTFQVPAWASALDLTLEGAQGGSDFATSANYGGKLTATLAVSPGGVLSLWVGGQAANESGGFNGGGAGDNGGRGGGGATDVRFGGSDLTDRILVAGGGGGAGYWASASLEVVGGQGGGETGGNGYRVPDFATNAGGVGGSQTSSGLGTCTAFNVSSVSGALGVGGTTVGKSCGCQGYGGGGGYWGGAASGNCRGGGGGSGYAAPLASLTNVAQIVGGATPGHGHIHIVAR